MKLAKHYLEQVAMADHLQNIAFIIFFVLFLVGVTWVIIGPKKMYEENGNMPLDDDGIVENMDINNKTQ